MCNQSFRRTYIRILTCSFQKEKSKIHSDAAKMNAERRRKRMMIEALEEAARTGKPLPFPLSPSQQQQPQSALTSTSAINQQISRMTSGDINNSKICGAISHYQQQYNNRYHYQSSSMTTSSSRQQGSNLVTTNTNIRDQPVRFQTFEPNSYS